MSLALATKGIICTAGAAAGGSYPIYTPVEDPLLDTGSLAAKMDGESLSVEISASDLRPSMKAEEQED